MEKEERSNVPKDVRDFMHMLDIEHTRRNPQYDNGDPLPHELSMNLLREVDALLRENGPRSTEELEVLLRKLDAAIAITNDPDARKLRNELLKRYWGDTDPGGDGI